jgi:hypothetical protein
MLLAGALIAITESSLDSHGDDSTSATAWCCHRPIYCCFERRDSPSRGVATRSRRIALAALKAGAPRR